VIQGLGMAGAIIDRSDVAPNRLLFIDDHDGNVASFRTTVSRR
jgi:hypothetical protein